MKKGWRVFAGICAVMIGIGMILCLISYAIGGRYSDLGLEYHRVWGPFGYVSGYNDDSFEQHSSDYVKAKKVQSPGGGEEYTHVDSIEVEVTDCTVYLENSASDKVTVQAENVPERLGLQYYQEHDGTLVVKTKENIKRGSSDAKIYIGIPEGASLKDVDLSIGAGALYVDAIQASDLDLEVGAGYAEVNGVKTGDMSVACDAGEAVISGESTGDVDIECGMGRVEFNATGSEEDYYYSLECGMGEIQYGSRHIGGVAREIEGGKGASKNMDVECNMGAVVINFI